MSASVLFALESLIQRVNLDRNRILGATNTHISSIEGAILEVNRNFDDLVALHNKCKETLELFATVAPDAELTQITTAKDRADEWITEVEQRKADVIEKMRKLISNLDTTEPNLKVIKFNQNETQSKYEEPN